ncbi:cell division protein FtsL [Aestuariispira insulae]|uniref:Cell division protein FtsL n=1 Tax=Aestuariispira insulae TaxID=1461337 RepID=A0A3D9HX84_9PROT|nr:hypothetical protein [Aestuariispira insulae]RED54107.1 hypothetical protein DFP90_101910 [Aestuariispira insulae]
MKIIAFAIWSLAAATAGYALFYVSYQVEALEQELAILNRQILKEQESLHVLEAEWSYLTRPDRLQKLTHELLPELTPVTAEQFTSLDALPYRTNTKESPRTRDGMPIPPIATPEQKSRRASYKGGQ